MEFVVNDGKGQWKFDGEKTYCFFEKDGEISGKIFAEFLPNPDTLWRAKLQRANLKLQDKAALNFKPSEVVYKLWEHKENANINA